ncbi:hypothetical protein ACH4ZU_09755 [Streptomyces sp. NPDC020472]|uniref:hypothetical protein n=1 Tax=Streptomyces sp. NPDC020472 TaxID=3365075 RepID=UPI0037926B85
MTTTDWITDLALLLVVFRQLREGRLTPKTFLIPLGIVTLGIAGGSCTRIRTHAHTHTHTHTHTHAHARPYGLTTGHGQAVRGQKQLTGRVGEAGRVRGSGPLRAAGRRGGSRRWIGILFARCAGRC